MRVTNASKELTNLNVGTVSCTSCPVNFTTSGTGATHYTDCYPGEKLSRFKCWHFSHVNINGIETSRSVLLDLSGRKSYYITYQGYRYASGACPYKLKCFTFYFLYLTMCVKPFRDPGMKHWHSSIIMIIYKIWFLKIDWWTLLFIFKKDCRRGQFEARTGPWYFNKKCQPCPIGT